MRHGSFTGVPLFHPEDAAVSVSQGEICGRSTQFLLDHRSVRGGRPQTDGRVSLPVRAVQPRSRRLAPSGELGPARVIETTSTQIQGPGERWRLRASMAGGGALPDIGLYCLNGVRALLAEEPVEVYAQVVNPQGGPRYAEVEETIALTLRFASGAIAQNTAS